MSPRFYTKVILITGASRGLGREVALSLARPNNLIIINYLKSKSLAQDTVNQINQSGGHAVTYQADVSKRKPVEKMAKFILSKYGQIDVLINNAGVNPIPSDWQSITEEVWRQVINTNLKGTFECCRVFGQIMQKQKNGTIINISSLNANQGNPDLIAYSASKSAIENLTKAFRQALPPTVKILCLRPAKLGIGMTKDYSQNFQSLLNQLTKLISP